MVCVIWLVLINLMVIFLLMVNFWFFVLVIIVCYLYDYKFLCSCVVSCNDFVLEVGWNESNVEKGEGCGLLLFFEL